MQKPKSLILSAPLFIVFFSPIILGFRYTADVTIFLLAATMFFISKKPFRPHKHFWFSTFLICLLITSDVIIGLVHQKALPSLVLTHAHILFIWLSINYFVFKADVMPKNAINILTICFTFQATLMILGLFRPEIRDLAETFQSGESIERNQGFRSVAISASQFFDLAVAFAIVTTAYCWSKLTSTPNHTTRTVLIFIALIFSGTIAARTAPLLSFLAIFGLFLVLWKKQIFWKNSSQIMIQLLPISIASLFTLSNTEMATPAFRLFFEWLTPTLTSTQDNILPYNSLYTLFEKMHYMPEISTVLFGDGYYFDSDGSYYGGTDAGYMRVLLFGGALYLSLTTLANIYIIGFHPAKREINKKHLLLILLVITFIANIKGHVILNSIRPNTVLFFILASFYFTASRKTFPGNKKKKFVSHDKVSYVYNLSEDDDRRTSV